MKVLLVEDDWDLGEMYSLQLKRSGHSVEWARDGQAALDLLDGQPADIIVLDILLPGSNGLNVLYELRSYDDWHELPVIILSNVPAADIGMTPKKLAELGVKAYLVKARTKPLQLVDTLAKVAA